MKENQVDLKNTVFMVMPFKDQLAEDAYTHSTRPVIDSCGLKIIRADEIFSPNPVFDDILASLEQAIIVIVDISGHNPNCFYELGVAHTLKPSRTIMITHDDYDKSPFDVAHFRIIKYQNTITGKTDYDTALRKTIQSIQSGIPELYADEFNFIMKVLIGAGKEHHIWILQAIALATRPIRASENTHVEGICPRDTWQSPGTSEGGPVIEYIKPFHETGYVILAGESLSLTNKGRAFADYVTAKGYKVYQFNDQVFVPDYKPFCERLGKAKVAPE